MKILIDLDDTVWDLLSTWVAYLNYIYKVNVKYEEITEWDMQQFFPNLTVEQIHAPLIMPSFWKHIRPREDAVKYIEKLSKDNEIYFVTATDYRNIPYKIDILKEYFPFISIDNLIITQDKTMIKGDILIDDNVDNLKDRRWGLLYTAQHNKNIDILKYPESIIRVYNWKGIFHFIECLNSIEKLDKIKYANSFQNTFICDYGNVKLDSN